MIAIAPRPHAHVGRLNAGLARARDALRAEVSQRRGRPTRRSRRRARARPVPRQDDVSPVPLGLRGVVLGPR